MSRSEDYHGRFEAALWESQRMLATLLSNLPGVAYRCLNDKSWTMDFVSDGCLELTGYRPDEVLSGRVSFGGDIIHPDDRQLVWDAVQSALVRRERFRMTYRIIHASGEVRWCYEQGSGIYSTAGELAALEGFITDISERMRALDDLEEQRHFLRQVIDIMPHFVFAKDREGRFVLVNKALAEAYGTDVPGLLGKTDADFNPNLEEVEHFRRHDLEVMDSGRERLIPEERITDATGTQRILQTIKRPLPDRSGSVNTILGVATDITALKVAEQRLKEAIEWLRLAQRSAQLGTFDWDEVSHSGRCSTKFTELFGLPPRDVMPMQDEWLERIHPEDRERVQRHQQFALRHPEQAFDYEYRTVWPDGSQHWLHCKGQVIANAAGEAVRVLGALIDITDRKKIEAELRENDQRTREVLDSSLDAVISIGTDGRVTNWNRAAELMFGWSREEMLGRLLVDTIIPLEHRSAHEQGMRRYLATGEKSVMGRRIETSGLRRSGEEFPVELAITEQLRMGKPVGFTAFVRDISESRHAEIALRESEERYRLMVEYGPIPIVVFDLDAGRFISVNELSCQFFGRTREELLNCDPFSLSPERQPNGALSLEFGMQQMERALTGELPVFNWTHIAAGGREVACEIRLVRMPASGRRIVRGNITDISERIENERRLQEVAERLDLAYKGGNIGLWDWKVQEAKIFFNEQWHAMLGYTQGDIGEDTASVRAILHDDDVPMISESVRRQFSGEIENWEIEYRVRAKDGEWRWVLDRGKLLERDREGKPLRALGVHIDVTARRKEERRFIQVVENMPSAIVLVNRQGQLVMANPVAEKMFGYSGAELKGRPVEQLIPARFRSRHIADRDSFMQQPETRMMGVGRDLFALRRDGSEFPVEIGLRNVETDEGVLVLASIVDITERQQAEAALRERELKLREAQRIGRVGSWHANIAEDTLEWSEETYRIFGLDPAVPVTNELFFEAVHPADRDMVSEESASSIATGKPYHVEHRILRPDGSVRHVLESAEMILDENGEVLFMSGTVHDITELWQKEKQLREREQLYAGLVETMREGVILADSQGKAIDANSAALRILGLSREELLGEKPTPADWEIILADGSTFDPSKSPSRRVLASGQPVTNEQMGFRQRDGSVRWVSLNATPMFPDDDETPKGVLVSFADITAMKDKEQELEKSEARFRQLIENSPVGIFIATNGVVRFANPAMTRLLGYARREDFVGRSVYDFVHPDYHELELERFSNLQDDPTTVRIVEEVFLTAEGNPIHVNVGAVPVEYEGRPSAQVAVWDITEARRAEESRIQMEKRIQHAQKLESLGVLAGGIAHDFNNLLAGMLGNAGLALMDLPPEHPARDAVESINRGAKSASELTRQMLAYSGKGRFVVQPISLTKVVEEMVHLLQTVISKKAVLRLDFAEQIPAVEADVAQVRQVVMNMITNASDALGEKSGIIMIRTGAMFATDDYLHSSYVSDSLEPGTYAYVEVSDTGKGMDDKTLAQIFEPFFTTKFTGRGLGLAAVLGIVRGHKGSIRVYSEPGKGTTFKVLFPCSAQTPIPLQQNEGFDPDWRGHGRVLVVDDEDTVRAVAQNILRRFGFESTLVANGRQGLEAFLTAPDEFRIVLMDLTMPEMSGEELFRELRLLRPDVKVILTSGYNEQEATNHFVGKGLAAFLQKPFTPAELITTIRQTLGE